MNVTKQKKVISPRSSWVISYCLICHHYWRSLETSMIVGWSGHLWSSQGCTSQPMIHKTYCSGGTCEWLSWWLKFEEPLWWWIFPFFVAFLLQHHSGRPFLVFLCLHWPSCSTDLYWEQPAPSCWGWSSTFWGRFWCCLWSASSALLGWVALPLTGRRAFVSGGGCLAGV